jgi:hypothetical protein
MAKPFVKGRILIARVVAEKPKAFLDELPVVDLKTTAGFELAVSTCIRVLCAAACKDNVEGRCGGMKKEGFAPVYEQPLLDPNCRKK